MVQRVDWIVSAREGKDAGDADGSVVAGDGGDMAQTAALPATPNFPLNRLGNEAGPVIRRHVEAGKPFTVAGECGVVLGRQDGTFETWVLPVKLLSNFRIRAEVEGYSVPIELNPGAAEIEVHPDHTTITYSHIAFTVRQTMFAPDDSPDGTGAVVLFQFDSARPMDVTFSFTPEVRPMWPLPSQGVPSPEWMSRGDSGFYVLHLDLPNMAAAVAMPHTRPGILAPYQEKPQVHPLQLKLHYDPSKDGDSYFPLLMAVGSTPETATTQMLEAKLTELNNTLGQSFHAHVARYDQMLKELTSIETPDQQFNENFRWAEISIEQLKARAQPSGETALVAGYYSSGDSARPGFGWFFGRDALYTLYAVNGYGDFKLSREELEFLLRRQRDDGKIMHEYSQTAAFLDWKALPYMYAAADATPLFLTAVWDYARSSGDAAFLRQNRAAILKAWQFETSHDSDGDGIYDNAQGTGWVESWPTGMPHQEIYLALLDEQASRAVAGMAALLGDAGMADSARARATEIAAKIEKEYAISGGAPAYAFSRNADGTLDRTATVYPAIAWWNGGAGLANADAIFSRWASHDFATDWGMRDVASDEKIYDPISYHQGSVWPLFTGWTSLAEYRTGRSLSGYAHLMQTADMTTTQDLGAVTELLSGDFFAPFGRSTSHQLWSSAMVVVPALRGLFGIDIDALSSTLTVTPHLPAQWDRASVRRVHVGQSVCDLDFQRKDGMLAVKLTMVSGETVHLKSGLPAASSVAQTGSSAAQAGSSEALLLPLPPVEVGIAHGLPLPGARTGQMKVLGQAEDAHSLHLRLEALAGSEQELMVRGNAAGLKLRAEGAELARGKGDAETVVVHFPEGSGYQRQDVTLRW